MSTPPHDHNLPPNPPPFPAAAGAGGQAPAKKSKKRLIGYPLVALVAMGVGAASGGGGNTATTASGGPTTTMTTTATKTEAPKDAATVTETETATETETVTAKPSGASSTVPGDGIYEVGRDILAGTYSSAKPDSGNCYWARLSSTDGFDGILANNNTAGQSLVTIKASDKFFETNGCSDWVRR